MEQQITTAVFPVAGMGTRFLPVTKAGPKEMLPIVDRPLIQYVVEEAIAVGFKHLIFVTSSSKRAIEDYFDSNYELESRLEQRGKSDILSMVKNLVPADVCISYVRQSNPLGLGDAVLRAAPLVGQQPFAVLLADDLMAEGARACLQPMLNIHQKTQASVIAVESVAPSETDKYGIVSLAENSKQVIDIVEKPNINEAPSTLAVTGRYLLTPRIFDHLRQIGTGSGGEIQLTDAIARLLKEETVMASPLMGERFDCGSCAGFLKATLAFAMRRPELKAELLETMQQLLETETN